MPIGLRLGLEFGLLLVLIIIGNAVAVKQFTTVGEVNSRIIEQDWVKAEAASTVDAVAQANAKRTLESLVTTRPEQLAQIRAAIAKNKKPSTRHCTRWSNWFNCPKASYCWRRSKKNVVNTSNPSPRWLNWWGRASAKSLCS